MYASYTFYLSEPVNGSSYTGLYVSGENINIDFKIGQQIQKHNVTYEIVRLGPLNLERDSYSQNIFIKDITNKPHENKEA